MSRKYIWDNIGFIEVVDRMGSDQAIENAARVSYSGGGTRTTRDTEALINYLMRHNHSSPVEMCEIVLHWKCPIFVARQVVRHRTAGANEISARYSVLPNEIYVPHPDHLAKQSTTNKQGRGELLPLESRQNIAELMRDSQAEAFDLYDDLLGQGLARELSRIVLPLGTYTEFVWKMDAKNLLHFLRLRMDEHAQEEVRIYANIIAEIVREWLPITYAAFEEHMLYSYTLSRTMLDVVKRLLRGEAVTKETSGLRARDWTELCNKLELANQS